MYWTHQFRINRVSLKEGCCLDILQADLIQEKFVVFVCSTTGQGEPPDNMLVCTCICWFYCAFINIRRLLNFVDFIFRLNHKFRYQGKCFIVFSFSLNTTSIPPKKKYFFFKPQNFMPKNIKENCNIEWVGTEKPKLNMGTSWEAS